MMLPIDYSKRPFRQKYIDEETDLFSIWYIFGEHPDGWVDIANPAGDVFTKVPKDVAERIVAARQKFVDVLVEVLS